MADRFSTNWDTKSVSKADSVAYLGRFSPLSLGTAMPIPFYVILGLAL